MNKNAKAWVAALRSGEYGQCKRRLTDGKGFCCLGVAVDLYIQSEKNLDKKGHHKIFWEKQNGDWVCTDNSGDTYPATLPPEVTHWLGLSTNRGRYDSGILAYHDLTLDNDDCRRSLDEIADIIESEPEGLFVKRGKKA